LTDSRTPPPHDLAAEEAFLGAVLLSRAALEATFGMVTAEDFYKPAHGHIYQACVDLSGRGDPVDITTVAAHLGPHLEHIGGLAALTALGDPALSSSKNAEKYARIIVGRARLRTLIAAAAEITAAAYDTGDNVDDTMDRAEALIYTATAGRARLGRVETISEAITRAVETLSQIWEHGGRSGVPTGFCDLDELLLGLHPGQLVTIAARPGTGKTALGTQIGVNAADAGHPVLFVSVEMSVDELINRVLSSESRVDLQRIRSGRLAERDWPHLSQAVGRLTGTPLYFLDAASDTVATVRAEIRRLAATQPPRLVIVDYLQLLQPEGRSRDNRQVDVAEIAKGLKRIAREFELPVVALAQLSRACEMRADKRPVLADLRESGDIENASDVVIGIYRDDYYNPDSDDRGVAELIIRKQRSGPQGTARVAWMAPYARFADMARI
jgi:replicative DNA helicase